MITLLGVVFRSALAIVWIGVGIAVIYALWRISGAADAYTKKVQS